MAVSIVGICNKALNHLGNSQNIQALSERSKEAVTCNVWYDTARDMVLADRDWSFARTYRKLALVAGSGESAASEWRFAYRYPSDCISVLKIVSGNRREAQPPAYAIGSDDVGKLIYSDTELAEIQYRRRVTDPTYYDAAFELALSYKLAALIAMPLAAGATGNSATGMMRALEEEYQRALTRAAAISGHEGQADAQPDSEFIRARL